MRLILGVLLLVTPACLTRTPVVLPVPPVAVQQIRIFPDVDDDAVICVTIDPVFGSDPWVCERVGTLRRELRSRRLVAN